MQVPGMAAGFMTLILLPIAAVGFAGLVGGRRLKAPPPSSNLPITFTAPRLPSILFTLIFAPPIPFCLWLLLDLLFAPMDMKIGNKLLSFGLVLVTLLTSALMAKVQGTRAIWPDMMTLSEDGIWCRVTGKVRQWPWTAIRDVKLGIGKYPPVILVLRDEDPERSEAIRKYPWLTKDAHEVRLGNQWKPIGLLTSGETSVRDAIRAVLDQRAERQPIIAQLSG